MSAPPSSTVWSIAASWKGARSLFMLTTLGQLDRGAGLLVEQAVRMYRLVSAFVYSVLREYPAPIVYL